MQLLTLLFAVMFFLSACASNPHTPVIETSPLDNTNTQQQHPATHSVAQDNPKNTQHNTPISSPANNALSDNNLWSALATGFRLQHNYYHPRVDEAAYRYINNQEYFTKLQQNAERYLFYITNEANKRNMPLEVVLLAIIESMLNPFAVSKSGATGIWQFISSTGDSYHLSASQWEEPRRDIIRSTNAGLQYLQDLHRQFDDWLLAMAAYNAGPGTVRRAIRNNKRLGLATDYWSLSIRKETDEYLPKIFALARAVQNVSEHGIFLDPITNAPITQAVKVTGTFNISQLASCADISLEEFYRFNPQFKKATLKHKTHTLLIPMTQVSTFIQRMDNYQSNCFSDTPIAIQNTLNSLLHEDVSLLAPTQQYTIQPVVSQTRIKKIYHQVQPGETLWRIAYNYKVSIDNIVEWNKLNNGTKINSGMQLLIWK